MKRERKKRRVAWMLALMLAAIGLFPSAVWAQDETPTDEKKDTGVTVEVTEASDQEALKAFLQTDTVLENFVLTKEQATDAKLQLKFMEIKEPVKLGETFSPVLGIYDSSGKLLGTLQKSEEVAVSAEPKEALSETEKGFTVKKTGTIKLQAAWGDIKAEGTVTAECSHPEESRKTNTTEATCEKEGAQTIACQLCGTVLEEKSIKATGHQFDQWKKVKEATWEEAGQEILTCSICGKEKEPKETREIPALKESHVNHDFSGEGEVKEEATCTKEGLLIIKCAEPNCDVTEQKTIPKKEHTFGEWKVTKEATWDQPGEETRICTMCQEEKETRAIPALKESHQHDFSGEETIVKEATCTEEGLKTVKCTEKKCDATEQQTIPKTAHTFGQWKVTKEATWEEVGERTRTCSVCQGTETEEIPSLKESHQHDFSGEETIVKPATCTEEGLKTVKCTEKKCDATEQQTIPKTAHTFGEWKVTKEATWTEEGSRERSCVCGEKEVEAIIALSVGHEHNFSGKEEIKREPTCLETGVKLIHCATEACPEVKEEEIPALGHTWGEWKMEKEATCLEKGVRSRTCSVCQVKETEATPLAAHQEGQWKVTREATCRDTGAKILPCAVCGKTLKEAEIEKLEHDWGKWKVTKEATQEAKGEKEAVCRVCGEKKTAEIPKLDKPEQVKPNVPKTDDPMEPSMWIAMGILAVAALVILVFMGRKFTGHGGKE